MRFRLSWLIFGFLVLSATLALWVRYELASPYYGRASESFVDIRHGAGTSEIAGALVAAGFTADELLAEAPTGAGGPVAQPAAR